MKYLLNNEYNKYNDIENIKTNLLSNRGITNYCEYLSPSIDVENNYKLLDNITKATECLLNHIKNKDKIFVVVDSDCDGISSASALINYLNESFENINICWQLHSEKQHGLSQDIKVPNGTKLILIPDASSNDYNEHKKLKEKGIDIIILDHHEADSISKNAIVVNNQLCNYPNKSLSGVGIVYKFLQALDEELWQLKANKYLDLVALGLIGDSMDISNIETKYYIKVGLENINNSQLKGLIKKQEYSTKGHINIKNISFYIVPLINAMIRVGKQEEKELMFRGFLECYEEFDYKPKGNSPIVKEDIYTRVARLCSNTKSRQDKMRDKAIDYLNLEIAKKNKNNDKIIVLNCKNEFKHTLTGVVAIKIAEEYNKPCILLNKTKDGLFKGSGRNTDKNTLKNMKKILNETNLFKAQGHPQAMGVEINGKVASGIKKINELLKDYTFDNNTYYVDFIIPFDELDDEIIVQVNLLKDIWGKGLEEPLIAIEEVEVKSSEIEIVGKKANTIKFNVDGVSFIKFKIKESEEILNKLSDWEENDKVFTLNIVGKCSTNEYNGNQIPQIEIEDYNIIKIKEVI